MQKISKRDFRDKEENNQSNGKEFKAAQTGGPSGGCIPAEHLDTPIDYESLASIGSMMGSGGLIVMDNTKCMVNLAKFYLGFTVDESCGKCTPCRIGTQRMLEILDRITEGKGEEEDIEKLEVLANKFRSTAYCVTLNGFPIGISLLLISTLLFNLPLNNLYEWAHTHGSKTPVFK